MPDAPTLAPLVMTVRSVDDVLLRGTLRYPEAARGVRVPLAVLAHQYPSTRDSFAPLVEDLLSLGVATLAFDLRGHGKSVWTTGGALVVDSPYGFDVPSFNAAFISSAGRARFHHINDDVFRVAGWGASQNYIDAAQIVLVGASVGGTGCVLAAPGIAGLRTLLCFGAAGVPAFGHDAAEHARRAVASLLCPSLFVSSEEDPYEGAENARVWANASPRARAVLVPGKAHAMALYYEVRDQVLKFLRDVL